MTLIGKQTHQQLADKYHCSVGIIRRYLEKNLKTVLNSPPNNYLNLIIDTTFFTVRYDSVY